MTLDTQYNKLNKKKLKKHLRPADRYTSHIYTLAAIKGETEKAQTKADSQNVSRKSSDYIAFSATTDDMASKKNRYNTQANTSEFFSRSYIYNKV